MHACAHASVQRCTYTNMQSESMSVASVHEHTLTTFPEPHGRFLRFQTGNIRMDEDDGTDLLTSHRCLPGSLMSPSLSAWSVSLSLELMRPAGSCDTHHTFHCGPWKSLSSRTLCLAHTVPDEHWLVDEGGHAMAMGGASANGTTADSCPRC